MLRMILLLGLLWTEAQCYSQNMLIDTTSSELDSSANQFFKAISDLPKIDSSQYLNQFNIDSLFKSKKLIEYSGEINAGMDYGLLVGYIDTSSSQPFRVLNSNADIQLSTLGLPLNVSYNYSTFRNPLGVNNYFRISLDTEKLRKKSTEKKTELIGNIESQIKDVKNVKGEVNGKLGYAEILMERLSREIASKKSQLTEQESQLKKYREDQSFTLDSTKLVSAASDSLKNNSKLDSLERKYAKTHKMYTKAVLIYDSVNTTYLKAQELYSRYSKLESQLEKQKDGLSNYLDLINKKKIENKLDVETEKRKSSILSNIKTLDIGLTYPKTTALSTNSVPIKGIHLELQREKWYSSIAIGTTVNNLFVSTNVVQNKLMNTQNLFNQFDFQSITQKGLLINVVSGYGTKDGNHIFLGLRHLSNSKVDLTLYNNLSSSVTTPSLSLELDTRVVPRFLPSTKIDFVYGKTSQTGKLIDGTRKSVVNSLFSNDRTNTGLVKIIQPIKFLRTELSTSLRWIDPSADTRSFGALQSNNLRFLIKSKHAITRRMRVGFNYRKDRNNLDNKLGSTVNLIIVGTEFSGQVGRVMNYFGSINYLTQTQTNDNGELSRSNNYMYGAGVSYQYRLNRLQNALTLSYNDYLLTDSISTNLFRTFSVSNKTIFKKSQNTVSLSYFKTDENYLGQNESFIFGDEFSIRKKKIKLTAGIKVATNDRLKSDFGFKLEILTDLTDFIQLSIKGEKLVLGDFYNNYDRERFNNFPYAILSNIKFKLN